MILTHAYVEAGMVNRAALTLDDVACLGVLTAKNLHSESFALRLTALIGTNHTIFILHLVFGFFFG